MPTVMLLYIVPLISDRYSTVDTKLPKQVATEYATVPQFWTVDEQQNYNAIP